MQARSAAFDLAVVEGGNVISQVDVSRGGVTLLGDVAHGEGKVRVNIDSPARRSLGIRLIDEDGTLTPRVGTDPLAPFGSELSIYVGFRYIDGSTELLPVGVFRITDVEAHQGYIEVEGTDRSIVVQRNLFEQPYVIAAGTEVSAAIEALIDSRYDGLTYVRTPTTFYLPLTVFEEGTRSGDPWRNAQSLAASAGLEVYFDPAGRVVIQPVPDPVVAVVDYTYAPGDDSILIASSAVNRMSTEEAKNVAVVMSEGTGVGTPIRRTAEVTDPTNPLYPAGPFGRRPDFTVTSLAVTAAQVQAAADARLVVISGGSELLGFKAVGHPAHEGGDVVVVESSLLNGGLATAVLSAWELPVTLRSEVTYATKARRSS